MTVQTWKAETQKILWGMIAVAVLGVLTGILSIVALAHTLMGGTPWYMIVFPLLLIAAYVFYFLGINNMAKNLTGEDQQSFLKLRLSLILSMVGVVCQFIPVAGGIIAGILGIIAAVFYLIAFKRLKDSATFPELARNGAKLLYVAAIIAIIGAALSIIPLLNIIGGLLGIAVFVLEVIGWVKIAKAEPAA